MSSCYQFYGVLSKTMFCSSLLLFILQEGGFVISIYLFAGVLTHFPHHMTLVSFHSNMAGTMQQELNLLEHLSLYPVFSGVCVAQSFVQHFIYLSFCLSVYPFTASDYTFGIFTLFVFIIFLNFMAVIIWLLDLKLHVPMQLVPITTDVVSSNLDNIPKFLVSATSIKTQISNLVQTDHLAGLPQYSRGK